ncbi:helix-turn-helix domain-containing protein [Micrococcoides hystricis]|uniref:Helix-turn-helix domain-containing protein n=1 Tax=Micrococcoides hystricis TaxID=1572761 RepID=A0ABV6PA41_9MICC
MNRGTEDEFADLLHAVRDGRTESLDELADQAHRSRFHLSRLLKQRLGFTLRDFAAAAKVDRGIQGLLEGYSVTQSQWYAGHESPSSYYRAFRRYTGLGPAQFRAQMRNLASYLLHRQDELAALTLVHRSFTPRQHQQDNQLRIRVTGAQKRSVLFVALHPEPLVKADPLLGIALLGNHEYTVSAIPDGSYYAMVVEVPRTTNLRSYFHMSGNRRQLERTPITFPLVESKTLTLQLRDLIPEDPPITVNLPKLFLEAAAGRVGLEAV